MTYIAAGKEILFQHRDSQARTRIADAVDNEKAHFLAAMANAPKAEDGGPKVEYPYMDEADKTCSIVWNPQYVERDHVMELLNRIIADAERMNIVKKLFFRGRSPADLGLDAPFEVYSMKPLLTDVGDDEVNIIHGIIGVITEAGELAELLRAYFAGVPFDPVHCLEETGDVQWYQARVLRGIHATLETMQRANIDKLHGRHGAAFDVFRDAHRDLATERAKLEIAAAPLFEDAIVAGIAPVPHSGDMTEMVDRMQSIGALGGERRSRNDPPLPPGIASAPLANGGENIGDDGVERHAKRPYGDCEGMDC